MILFQVDKISLFKDIKDFQYTISETQEKFGVKSSYIEGDYRINRTKTSNITLQCTGLVESQHLLHYLRSLSAKDKGRGDIKCYLIEKYNDRNALYQPISAVDDTTTTDLAYRVFFNYCHVDIKAENPMKNLSGDLEYDIKFEVSFWNSNCYDITKSNNGFIVDNEKYNNLIAYDASLLYDTQSNELRYDEFLSQLVLNSASLYDNQNNLSNLYNAVTCCEGKPRLWIFFIDHIIKPFIESNKFVSSGLINKNTTNQKFKYNSDTFLQFVISNSLVATNKQFSTNISFPRDLIIPNQLANSSPFNIGNYNITSNSYTTNAIIQLFRTDYGTATESTPPLYYIPFYSSAFSTLFEKLDQTFSIKTNNSQIDITCKDNLLKDNIRMLIIHPHTQKLYAIFGNITPNFSVNDFSFDFNNSIIDLESYILEGKITVTSSNYNNQSWLSFSPSYESDIYSNRFVDNLTFSTKFVNNSNNIQNDKAIFLQIQSFQENKMI